MGERLPAFYALRPGGWRDYWTLLHPPYTLWHLSYVAIGASLAPSIDVRWLVETLAAFFLAVGVAAHALDELNGRPLRTRIPNGVLWALAAAGLAGAVAFGIHGVVALSPWIAAFIGFGAFAVVAYNLELFGGRFHSDLWFGVAWGGFPALTGAFAQTGRVSVAAVAIAAACTALSVAQRALSTPVRELRRRVASVVGEIAFEDGTVRALDAAALRTPAETALRWMALAVPLVAIGLVASRF
jgi:hypothetical protein